MSPWMTLIGGLITAVFVLAGVLWTARSSVLAERERSAVAREVSRTAPYDSLVERLTRQDTRLDVQDTRIAVQDGRIDQLEDDQRIDRRYITDLLDWARQHIPDVSPPTPPTWVHKAHPTDHH